MTKSSSSDNSTSSNTTVIKDYGPSIGKITKIDLSSNGLLEVIAGENAACD